MSQSLAQRWGTLAAAVAIGVAFAVALSYWPRSSRSPLAEKQTLLGRAADLFTDARMGLAFKPPVGWFMQGQTIAPPEQLAPGRLVVKYKRLARDVPVAWLRVYVFEPPADQSLTEFLKKHKLPERSWKVAKEVETDVRVGKEPAARITYSGPLDPNGLGMSDYTAQVYAVRRGKLLFEISGTYPTTDEEAHKQFQTSLDSFVFSK